MADMGGSRAPSGFGVCPSTWAFVKEGRRTPRFSLFDMLHGYVYARWPYLYIAIATGEHPLARVVGPALAWLGRRLPAQPGGATFADTYHGKVVPLPAARQLVSVREDIRVTDLERVIPYALARDIILQAPDHLVALECPCRAARADPCLPLDVCLIVGEPFASFTIQHHARRARWITSVEAQAILQAEHDRGHVHHAFFKDAMLGRFYAICNCCACCCGAMQAHRNGTPMLASSGYVNRLDPARCVGCGDCAPACPFEALSLVDSLAQVDEERCMGCGVCVAACDTGALSLERDPRRAEPLEIGRLIEAAAAPGGD